MKLGTCVQFDEIGHLEEKFATLQQHHFKYCQLVSWKPGLWTKENAETINVLIQKYGITISAFWCGWSGPKVWDFYEGQLSLGLVPPEYRAVRVGELCRGADFAKLLKVMDVVTHMGYIPENPYDVNFPGFCLAVRTVAEHLKKNGQFLLFETGQETPVTMLRCFEQTGCDNLGVNLDTANLILYGKANPVDAAEIFGKYIRNIHAKDGMYPVNGHDLGIETPIGQGKVDFKAFFKALHRLGYDSHITIEREISGEQQTKDILASREYLEAIYKEVYGQ